MTAVALIAFRLCALVCRHIWARMQDDFASDPPTPKAAPAAKVQRMRGSPFHKASGKPSASLSPPAPSDSDAENDEAAAAAAPPAADVDEEPAGASRRVPRRGAAGAKKQYVDLLSGDDEDSDEGDESEEEESDFEPVSE